MEKYLPDIPGQDVRYVRIGKAKRAYGRRFP